MSNLRTVVRGAYDVQKLRIQMGNRIVENFKVKLGQEPSKKEDSLDADGRMILNSLRVHYKKITDGVTAFPRQKSFKGDEVISDYTELCLIAQYVDLEIHEAAHFKRMGNILRDYSIWSEFLEGVKGIGPAMGGVIISEIDIHASTYPSSLWKYAGLDVAEDGVGRTRRKEHLVEREYIDKKGNPATRVGITFNPFLKTKLIGVLGPSFLRTGKTGYSEDYYHYKNRIENHPAHIEKTPLHRHRMAIRYMIKRFLVDLHMKWRELEGLPVSVEYNEGKLGHKHTAKNFN